MILDIVLWGIVGIGITGFVCCMVSLVLDIRLFRLKQELWEDEYRLRAAAQAASLSILDHFNKNRFINK